MNSLIHFKTGCIPLCHRYGHDDIDNIYLDYNALIWLASFLFEVAAPLSLSIFMFMEYLVDHC